MHVARDADDGEGASGTDADVPTERISRAEARRGKRGADYGRERRAGAIARVNGAAADDGRADRREVARTDRVAVGREGDPGLCAVGEKGGAVLVAVAAERELAGRAGGADTGHAAHS